MSSTLMIFRYGDYRMNNMKYIVISMRDYMPFIEEVNQRLEEGWEVTGGVSITTSSGNTLFSQALMRK